MDYSKIVIISNPLYINFQPAVIDNDEYVEMQRNLKRIVSDAISYVDTYVAHRKGEKVLNPAAYRRLYQNSTLPYFEDILGI